MVRDETGADDVCLGTGQLPERYFIALLLHTSSGISPYKKLSSSCNRTDVRGQRRQVRIGRMRDTIMLLNVQDHNAHKKRNYLPRDKPPNSFGTSPYKKFDCSSSFSMLDSIPNSEGIVLSGKFNIKFE